MEGFLKQQVFYFKGEFASRLDVIRYVANKAGGVHFDTKRSDKEQLLNRIRNVVTIKVGEGYVGLGIDVNKVATPSDEFVLRDKDYLDPVFVELLATCKFLSESASIQDLIERLRLSLDR